MASPSSNRTGHVVVDTFPITGRDGQERVVTVREEAADGRLVCGCRKFTVTPPTKLPYCEHLNEAINLKNDSLAWWPNSAVDQLTDIVQVPISVTPPLSVEVWLRAYNETNRMREALINLNPRMDGEFLCNLQHGEGRRTLKGIIEQLLVALYNDRPSCQGQFHDDDTELADDPASPHAMRDTYSLCATGYCPDCVPAVVDP